MSHWPEYEWSQTLLPTSSDAPAEMHDSITVWGDSLCQLPARTLLHWDLQIHPKYNKFRFNNRISGFLHPRSLFLVRPTYMLTLIVHSAWCLIYAKPLMKSHKHAWHFIIIFRIVHNSEPKYWLVFDCKPYWFSNFISKLSISPSSLFHQCAHIILLRQLSRWTVKYCILEFCFVGVRVLRGDVVSEVSVSVLQTSVCRWGLRRVTGLHFYDYIQVSSPKVVVPSCHNRTLVPD